MCPLGLSQLNPLWEAPSWSLVWELLLSNLHVELKTQNFQLPLGEEYLDVPWVNPSQDVTMTSWCSHPISCIHFCLSYFSVPVYNTVTTAAYIGEFTLACSSRGVRVHHGRKTQQQQQAKGQGQEQKVRAHILNHKQKTGRAPWECWKALEPQSCPQWPTCSSKTTPPKETQTVSLAED